MGVEPPVRAMCSPRSGVLQQQLGDDLGDVVDDVDLDVAQLSGSNIDRAAPSAGP